MNVDFDTESEVKEIESLSKRLLLQYYACPAFFFDQFTDACQTAFTTKHSQERRRLVLIYIYHAKNVFKNIFCRTIFSSEISIKYFLENYIV
ncbi:hypothetical protein I4U23_000158 [Adineta vaga]|nr:hypothetical protein I4U23_000158 [Adineta vaga]